MPTKPTYLVQYSNDETRSAGDAGFRRLCDARRTFHAMMRKHPDADMTLWMMRARDPAVCLNLYDAAARTSTTTKFA